MATELYGSDPVFTATMDEFLAAGGDDGDGYAGSGFGDAAARVGRCDRRSTAAVRGGCSLWAMMVARPGASNRWPWIGHSVDELAAATLAGVFDISAGATLMRHAAARPWRRPGRAACWRWPPARTR